MSQRIITSPTCVLLVAVTMLTIFLPTAIATHNSVGVGAQLAEATEYDTQTGELLPDIDPALVPEYHGAEVAAGETDQVRKAPLDQRGSNYAPPECTPYTEETKSEYDDELTRIEDHFDNDGTNWANASDRIDTDICFIGYLDMRHQYVFVWNLLLTHPSSSDTLYHISPDPGDEEYAYCTGQEDYDDPEERILPITDNDALDQEAANLERTAEPLVEDDHDCDGEDHHRWHTGQHVAIDTSLLEAPVEEASQATWGDAHHSGTLTLPNTLMRYVYLFGQPHPAVDLAETSISFDERPKAGEGFFGPDPAQGGDPIRDITNACGVGEEQRTKTCELLTPADIRAYDADPPADEDGTARVCTYQPSYFSVSPGELTTGACGAMTGSAIGGAFVDVDFAGGLGIEEGPPTYMETMPGWHGFSHLLNHESSTWAADVGCDAGSLCHDFLEDEDVAREAGAGFFVAVNPKVPDFDAEDGSAGLWCVRPNILTTGDDMLFRSDIPEDENGEPLDWNDPDNRAAVLNGMDDLYDAQAIDVDVNVHAITPLAFDVRDIVHDDVRTVLGPVQEEAPDRADLLNPESLNNPLEPLSYNDRKEDVKDATPDEADGPIERADPVDSSDTTLGFPGAEGFDYTFEAGMGCTPDGFITDRATDEIVPGGFNFFASLSHTTQSVKDASALDEDLLPAQDDESHGGAWQVDSYSFGGNAVAHVDTPNSSAFDDCAEALGEPQPHRDFCPWRGVWDAYNEECNEGSDDADRECGEILADRHYNVTGPGVGLFYVLELTGPVLVEQIENPLTLEEDSHLLGADDPTAQNCIVGTSIGFQAHLHHHVDGLADPEEGDYDEEEQEVSEGYAAAILDALCSDEHGETLFLDDAFSDGGPTGGSFSSDWFFNKLTPTTAIGQDLLNGFGEGDALCMNAIWSVEDGESADDNTKSLNMTGINHYQHNLPLDSQADYVHDDAALEAC